MKALTNLKKGDLILRVPIALSLSILTNEYDAVKDKIAKTRKNIKKRERKETPLEYIRLFIIFYY